MLFQRKKSASSDSTCGRSQNTVSPGSACARRCSHCWGQEWWSCHCVTGCSGRRSPVCWSWRSSATAWRAGRRWPALRSEQAFEASLEMQSCWLCETTVSEEGHPAAMLCKLCMSAQQCAQRCTAFCDTVTSTLSASAGLVRPQMAAVLSESEPRSGSRSGGGDGLAYSAVMSAAHLCEHWHREPILRQGRVHVLDELLADGAGVVGVGGVHAQAADDVGRDPSLVQHVLSATHMAMGLTIPALCLPGGEALTVINIPNCERMHSQCLVGHQAHGRYRFWRKKSETIRKVARGPWSAA